MKTEESLWLRCGDGDNYENYGEDFSAAALTALECGVHKPLDWHIGPRASGFNCDGYDGPVNYVSCYWGDEDANLLRPLNKREQKEFTRELQRLEKEYSRG